MDRVERLIQYGKSLFEYVSEFMARKPKVSAVIIGVIAFFIANQLLLFPIFSPESGAQMQITRKLSAMYSEEGSLMFFSLWAHIGIALTAYLVAKLSIRKLSKE